MNAEMAKGKKGQVWDQIESLSMAIGLLDDSIKDHEERISSVLREYNTKDAQENVKEDPDQKLVPLANSIRVITRSIKELESRMRDMADRISI
jgi:chaperonin cofactor prefoldin